MGSNLADLSPEQRTAIALERERALERHEASKVFYANVEQEYDRIMKERIWNPSGWRARIGQFLDAIPDARLRTAVQVKINTFLGSIGG